MRVCGCACVCTYVCLCLCLSLWEMSVKICMSSCLFVFESTNMYYFLHMAFVVSFFTLHELFFRWMGGGGIVLDVMFKMFDKDKKKTTQLFLE